MIPSKNVTTADFVLFAKRLRSINERTNIPFYIFAPDFRDSSVGIRVLHYLCHILNEMGEEAYIVNVRKTSPHLRTPKLTYAQLEQHFVAGLNPVSIYPEVICKNPANTPLVVRWLLNIPGHLGKPIEFEPQDIIYYYEPWCLPSDLSGEQLWIHPVNHAVFNNDENLADTQRTLECYYAHKYFLDGLPIREEHKNLLSLGQNIKRSHKEIAEILRKSKVLYLYEPSGMLHEALACGCPVVLVRSRYWPLGPEDSHHKTPGCAVIDEPDALAKATTALKLVPDFHIRARDNSWNMTRQMVEAVYRAEAELKKTGKPLLNSLQQLWALGSEDRILNLGKLRRLYGESAIYLADTEAEHSAPELSPTQRYAAYLAASSEKSQELNEAVTVVGQGTHKNRPSIQQLALPDALITIVVRASLQHLDLLANTIDSLAAHVTPCWHLVIVSDFDSPEALDEINRIHWLKISRTEAAKSFIAQTTATLSTKWVLEAPAGTLLDELIFQRLQQIADDGIHAIFADNDFYDRKNQRHSPRFKPGVNPAALMSSDLAGPLLITRDTWLTLDRDPEHPAPWLSSLWQIANKYGWQCIKHIPQVLFSLPDSARHIRPGLIPALENELAKRATPADLQAINPTCWAVLWPLPPITPAVQILIQTDGDIGLIERCLEAIGAKTNYPAYSVGLLVSHQVDTNRDPDLDVWLDYHQANNPQTSQWRQAEDETYASFLNRALATINSDFTLFIADELVALQADWLNELVRACQPTDVVAASPRLIQPQTGHIENCGYVLGFQGWRGSAYFRQARVQTPDDFDWIDASRDISTLTTTCALIRTKTLYDLGGFNDLDAHTPGLNSGFGLMLADFSLRCVVNGRRIIYAPRATLAGSAEPDSPKRNSLSTLTRQILADEARFNCFKARWWPEFAHDPFWNPNLSLVEHQPTLETDYFADWTVAPAPVNKPKILAHVLANAQADFRITDALGHLKSQGRVSTCVWVQRIDRPLRLLTASEIIRLSPDTHIVQNYVNEPAISALDDWLKIPQRPFTVLALDDVASAIDPSSPFYKNFSPDTRTRMSYALARCDRMVVSTEFLADHYRNFIKDIRVVPNRLDMGKWLHLAPRKGRGPKVRIGWAGGTTHQRDLMLLKEVIEQTRDEADWIFFGMCPPEIAPLLAESHPFVAYGDYPTFLANLELDLAVAPLADNLFNRGKSNLRLLELGILGLPVVCSDIDPYQNSPACRVKNSVAAWVSALRERIHDRDAREREGRAMRQWVLQNYLLDNHLDEWLDAHMPG